MRILLSRKINTLVEKYVAPAYYKMLNIEDK